MRNIWTQLVQNGCVFSPFSEVLCPFFLAMPNILDSTLHDYHDSVCGLQSLFKPRTTSMYDSAPTRGRDSEPPLSPSSSNQSFRAYKCLPSPISNSMGCRKVQLPVMKGPRVNPRPQRSRISTPSCSGSSGTHTPSFYAPSSRNNVHPAEPTPHRMSDPYLESPSFLDLTSSRLEPLSASFSTMTFTTRIKRKPPPLILLDSFHSPRSKKKSSAFPINAKPAPLPSMTPITPFIPITHRYQMPSEKERLRRRLLKLQRTFGEQITPGLVIRQKPNSETTAGPPNNLERETIVDIRRSVSLDENFVPFQTTKLRAAPTDQDLLNPDSNPLKNLHKRQSSAPEPSSPISVHLQRQDLPETPSITLAPNQELLCPNCNFLENTRKRQSGVSLAVPSYLPETVALTPITLTEFPGLFTPLCLTPTVPTFEFGLNDDDAQDSSSSDDDYDSPSVYDSSPPSPLDDSCPPSPFNDFTPHSPLQSELTLCQNTNLGDVPFLALDQTGLPSTPCTPGIRRQERRQGWSGEWNQPHIQDVIEKLRML